jgi:hypothetical protein
MNRACKVYSFFLRGAYATIEGRDRREPSGVGACPGRSLPLPLISAINDIPIGREIGQSPEWLRSARFPYAPASCRRFVLRPHGARLSSFLDMDFRDLFYQ